MGCTVLRGISVIITACNTRNTTETQTKWTLSLTTGQAQSFLTALPWITTWLICSLISSDVNPPQCEMQNSNFFFKQKLSIQRAKYPNRKLFSSEPTKGQSGKCPKYWQHCLHCCTQQPPSYTPASQALVFKSPSSLHHAVLCHPKSNRAGIWTWSSPWPLSQPSWFGWRGQC